MASNSNYWCSTCGKDVDFEPTRDHPDCDSCTTWWSEQQIPLPLITPERATREIADIVELSPAERRLIHAN